MTRTNPAIWYILMSNVPTICSGAGDLRKENILHLKQMRGGLSLSGRSEHISLAFKNFFRFEQKTFLIFSFVIKCN